MAFTWVEHQPTGDVERWYPVAADENFVHLMAGVFWGGLYESNNGGRNWHLSSANRFRSTNWVATAMSADGKYRLANAEYNGRRAFQSSDYGNTWTKAPAPAGGQECSWYGAAMDGTGQYRIMGVYGGGLFTSRDYGNTWSQKGGYGNGGPRWMALDVCRDNGLIMVAGIGRMYGRGGRLYRSGDGGATWAEIRPRGDNDGLYYDAAISADGNVIVVVEEGFQTAWLSEDSGDTWSDITPQENPGELRSCALSVDGNRVIVCANAGGIYFSENRGASWCEERPSGEGGPRAWSVCAGNADLTRVILCHEGATTSSADGRGRLFIGTLTGAPSGPIAKFSATPLSGDAPLTVDFTDESEGATSWTWDFGDGQGSTDENPQHEYANPGTYTVTLSVTNAQGLDIERKVNYVAAVDSVPPLLPANLLPTMKTGSSQADAGAQPGERWYTIGHATHPDGTLMVGL